MSSTLFLLIAGIFAVILIFAIRWHWLIWKTDRYLTLSTYWTIMTNQSPKVEADMMEIWPIFHTLFEIWRWDFNRYVVNQGLLADMEDWVDYQKSRPGLDWNQFAEELEKALVRNATSRKTGGDDAENDSSFN